MARTRQSAAEALAELAEVLRAAQPERSAEIDRLAEPTTNEDQLADRLVALVSYADQLDQPIPRGPLGRAMRRLTTILGTAHPGRSVEVRIPPYAAVQCGLGETGPTHTRGTPPNVIETDAITFLRLATGRLDWASAVHDGRVHASGLRADLSAVLPLV